MGAEVVQALDAALEVADEDGSLNPERIELLGGGWVCRGALAIAVHCVLRTTDPAEAMALAVNHSDDSDNTSSIAGNLLGAALGTTWLDPELLGELEGRAVIEQRMIFSTCSMTGPNL